MLEKMRKNKWDAYVPLPLKGLRRSGTVLLYRQHQRKTRKRVCGILPHHDPTGLSACENSMSLLFVVKAWTNFPTRLEFDNYLFILSWNEIIGI